MYDLIIRGGLVVDGTGVPGRHTDIGITDGRVAAVGCAIAVRGIAQSSAAPISAVRRTVFAGPLPICSQFPVISNSVRV